MTAMLEIEGKRTLDLTPPAAWRLLMDPEVLRAAIPGCEELEATGRGRYRVALRAGLGFLSGRFEGEASLEEVVEPVSYRLVVHARGKLGSIEGTTDIRLAPAGGGTKCEIAYASRAKLGGVLAAVRARAFQGAAKSFADEFFDQLASGG